MLVEWKLAIYSSLADGYLSVRVAHMRNYVQFAIEGKEESPWRMHWPEDRGDDQLFTDYSVISSMRVTTFETVMEICGTLPCTAHASAKH